MRNAFPRRNMNNMNNMNMNMIRSYGQNVIDHYQSPKNVGSLDSKDINVGSGLVGAPACGDVMRLQINVDADTGIILDTKFKTFGCGSAIASSSYGSEYIKGKHIDDAYNISNRDIANYLKLPPIKIHCSMLMEDAVKSAINDYKRKSVLRSE
jgi:Fe-S cluster assembly scaffold IscU